MQIELEDHPLARPAAFVCELPGPLGGLATPQEVLALLRNDAPAAGRSDDVHKAVRDLLRHGGYKPTGRGKPSSEYLLRAAAEGELRSINLLVDSCNAVSLASGLPISVVDAARLVGAARIGIAPANSSYVFNPSGQEIRVDGLLCLFDEDGPCANAVKDAQRTKTDGATTRALAIVWGTVALPDHAERAATWYRELLEREGALCQSAPVSQAPLA